MRAYLGINIKGDSAIAFDVYKVGKDKYGYYTVKCTKKLNRENAIGVKEYRIEGLALSTTQEMKEWLDGAYNGRIPSKLWVKVFETDALIMSVRACHIASKIRE